MNVSFRDASGGEDVGPCAFREDAKVAELKQALVEEMCAKKGAFGSVSGRVPGAAPGPRRGE